MKTQRYAIFDTNGLCIQCADLEEAYAETFLAANTPSGGIYIAVGKDQTDIVAGKCRRTPNGVIEKFDPNADIAYQKERRKEYLPVGDQLDALWHAMDAGVLPKVEPMYSQIKSVKQRHPKE